MRAIDSPWYRQIQAGEDEEEESTLSTTLDDLADELGSPVERLPTEIRSLLRSAISQLDELELSTFSMTSRSAIAQTVARLRGADAVEEYPEPRELAERLAGRRPLAVPFDDQHRMLGFSHDLSGDISAAFQNLADFGGLDLAALRTAIRRDDSGAKRTLLNNSVAEINRRLREEWGQSDLNVDFDPTSLEDFRITVAGADGEQFDLTHRSDGMRMFLALCAFLAKEDQDPRPILLIDELERHLHYEAQADIVSMFDGRTDVAQVIYTTHSIGCLPQDLGRGARVVVPDTAAGTSIVNNLWLRDEPGVSPLMAAMGAATLPLQPSRPLVYCEGPSDAMILPSLIREAIGGQPLDYLMVSGASAISRANFEEFDQSASRVVYLLDGDKGGNDRKRFLQRNGVPAGRILQLEAGLTLEDLVDPGLWRDATNRAIAEIAAGDYDVTDSLRPRDIPTRGRLARLALWCASRNYRVPEKLRLAHTILDLMTGSVPRAERRWLDARHVGSLHALHGAVSAKFSA